MIEIKVPDHSQAPNMRGTCLAMLIIHEFLSNRYTGRPSLRTIGKYIDRQWPRKGKTYANQALHYIKSLEKKGEITQIKIGNSTLYRVNISTEQKLDILKESFYEGPSRNND